MNELNDISKFRKVKPMEDEKTKRILDAAQDLILAQGLRATTMEAIARSAGVAKPTLYGRFPDKTSVFRAAVLRLLDSMRKRFSAEMQGPGRAKDRIAGALAVKFAMVNDILARSPHAAQLMEDNIAHAGAEFADLNAWVIGEVARALAEDGHPDPENRAMLLHACLDGLKSHAATEPDLAAKVRFVTSRLLD